ncbi:MAG: septum site-determining protein MinC [Anaerolineales bacterium]|nr:septum site-determining protein MinC [Anaerolineales bacterium]MDW8227947.1 septum site-determining protein MinC [Anaerolineales bacterium]
MNVKRALTIKGIRDGLLVTCHKGSWNEMVEALNAQIEDQPAFFKGARLALDIGPCEVRVADLSALRDSLSERGIHLWAVLSTSPVTEATAQNLGLATRLSRPQPLVSAGEAKSIPAEAAKWVRGPLRSGTRVEHDGPVVVLGDVNPGAEIIAHGSVIVWGRLRGVVHAGAAGDETAVVCALDLSPTQLRIAGEIAVSPPRRAKIQPEIARLVDGRLVAEPWQSG